MKKSSTKSAAVIGAAIMMTGLFTGCGSQSAAEVSAAETGTQAADSQPMETVADTSAADTSVADTSVADADIPESGSADISGSITLAGSTSMEKLSNAVAEVFMQKYPNVTVNAEFTGSSAGVEAVLAGNVDIGNSSRNLKDEEKAGGAVENIVAIDGIAVVTDPSNTVSDLSREDLIGIYTGEITNWSVLGGEDEAIVVIGREAGSGTRSAFEELLEIEDQCAYAGELDSTGAVMAKASSTKGAIGYVSLDVLDDTVKALSIDGTEPGEEAILAGEYILSRPFVMATNGEISAQSEAVQELFRFLGTEEGEELIKSVGLIPGKANL